MNQPILAGFAAAFLGARFGFGAFFMVAALGALFVVLGALVLVAALGAFGALFVVEALGAFFEVLGALVLVAALGAGDAAFEVLLALRAGVAGFFGAAFIGLGDLFAGLLLLFRMLVSPVSPQLEGGARRASLASARKTPQQKAGQVENGA